MKGIWAWVILGMVPSCVQEEHTPEGDGKGGVYALFNIIHPADHNEHLTTRSLTGDDEAYIGSIDVLAFLQEGSGYRYSYQARGTYDASAGSFTTVIRQYAQPQVFVIVANASDAVVSARLTQQDNLDEALERLIIVSEGEWPAKTNGSNSFTPLPMYVKTTPVMVTGPSQTFGPYKLLRMLARIDISLSALASSHFKLTEVMLYNRMTAGYVAYEDSNWDAAGEKVRSAWIPPFIPGTEEKPQALLPSVTYRVPPADSLIRSLYTFEAKGATDKTEATAIVIGGNYAADGNPSESGEISYYRIDIHTPQTPSGYVSQDMLRNHIYQIAILSFSGKGSPTPDEAFFQSPLIETTITPWNLAQVNTVFDGQHQLRLSKDKIAAGNEEINTLLEILTDYTGTGTGLPDGIYISGISYPSGGAGWLNISNETGGNGSLSRSVRLYASSNGSGQVRSATFTVTAGNLRYLFNVTQSNAPWITIQTDAVYLMDGIIHTLKASSAKAWTAEIKEGSNNGGGISRLLTVKGGETTEENVLFTTYNDWDGILSGNPDKTVETAVLTFRDPDGVSPDKEVKVWMASGVFRDQSNCYMLPRHSSPILIPVARANEPSVTGTAVIGQQIFPDDVLEARFIWTDSPNGYTPAGSVRSVLPAGDGSRGYILVRPGGSDGNTLVAVLTNSIIRWSWHIWVTDYVPAGTWMDRNIGALSNVPGSPGTACLLFQWGRKEPFPGVSMTWYDPNGTANQPAITQITGNINAPVTEITNSVRNPLGFFTSTFNARTNSWGGELPAKEIYDPCPAGYKVPLYTAWENLNTTNFPWNGSGRTNASVGGFYPVTGARNNGGVPVQPGNGYYWSTRTNMSLSPRLSFSSTAVGYNPDSYSNHIDAYAIRCIAISPQLLHQ